MYGNWQNCIKKIALKMFFYLNEKNANKVNTYPIVRFNNVGEHLGRWAFLNAEMRVNPCSV